MPPFSLARPATVQTKRPRQSRRRRLIFLNLDVSITTPLFNLVRLDGVDDCFSLTGTKLAATSHPSRVVVPAAFNGFRRIRGEKKKRGDPREGDPPSTSFCESLSPFSPFSSFKTAGRIVFLSINFVRFDDLYFYFDHPLPYPQPPRVSQGNTHDRNEYFRLATTLGALLVVEYCIRQSFSLCWHRCFDLPHISAAICENVVHSGDLP